MIVAVKKGKSVKGAGIQTIHSKRYALLVSALHFTKHPPFLPRDWDSRIVHLSYYITLKPRS
jgi:hypothetical protein